MIFFLILLQMLYLIFSETMLSLQDVSQKQSI